MGYISKPPPSMAGPGSPGGPRSALGAHFSSFYRICDQSESSQKSGPSENAKNNEKSNPESPKYRYLGHFGEGCWMFFWNLF